jgi:PAS domain S-box-containing protein
MRDHTDIINQTKRSSHNHRAREDAETATIYVNDRFAGTIFTVAADTDNHFIRISDRMLMMLDFTREEIQTQFSDSFIPMVHPDDRKKVKDFFAENREFAGTGLFRCRIAAKNDSGYIWIKNAVQLCENDHKLSYHCQVMDITEEMEKQYSLEYLNCEHEVIMDSISAGIVVTDVDYPYTYFHISEEAARLFGYTVDEMREVTENRAVNLIHCEDRLYALYNMEAGLLNGSYSAKFRVQCKDGSMKHIKISGKSMSDRDGRPCLLSAYLDETAEHEYKEMIYLQNEFLSE